MNDLKKRILDISYRLKLSHISSCLNLVTTLDNIYKIKKDHEPLILSNGHAALALYCVLEKYFFYDAEKLFHQHGVHPNRDMEHRIWASSGSLGHGLGIGIGYALADRTRNVYVVMSDGEMMEGSVWEALRIAGDLKLENLRVTIIANGYGAYRKIETDWLDMVTQYFYPSLMVKVNMFDYPDYLNGQQGHYHVLTDEEYKEVSK